MPEGANDVVHCILRVPFAGPLRGHPHDSTLGCSGASDTNLQGIGVRCDLVVSVPQEQAVAFAASTEMLVQ